MTTNIISTDHDPICEEYKNTQLAKCLVMSSIEYSVESKYHVVALVDNEEVPFTVSITQGWGE